jgi:DNA invertase Pin-like site-specific DNA recombinase
MFVILDLVLHTLNRFSVVRHRTQKGESCQMSKTKRFAIYARTATVQEQGPSLATAQQIHECKEYGTKKGYVLGDNLVFQEVVSGNSAKRPCLEAIFEAAKEGRFDVLIIRDYARLARNGALLHDIIRLFAEMGIDVESASEQDEVMQVAGHLWEIVEVVQKELLIKRMRAGKAAKRQEKSNE